jgi:hypothetical protein
MGIKLSYRLIQALSRFLLLKGFSQGVSDENKRPIFLVAEEILEQIGLCARNRSHVPRYVLRYISMGFDV